MNPQTKLILEILAVIILVSILGYVVVKIYGGGSDTPSAANCHPGTKRDATYGCVTCSGDPNSDQSCWVSKTACKHGSFLETSGGKGVCSCIAPYFGANCDQMCSSNVPCPTGSKCVGGKCVGGSTCNCPEGQTCSDGKTCDTCLPGRGPPGDCSKKLFSKPIILYNQCKRSGLWTTDSTINQQCKQNFGPRAEMSTYSGENYASDPNPCGGTQERYVCKVPKYYADSSWNPATYNPRVDGVPSSTSAVWKPPGYAFF